MSRKVPQPIEIPPSEPDPMVRVQPDRPKPPIKPDPPPAPPPPPSEPPQDEGNSD